MKTYNKNGLLFVDFEEMEKEALKNKDFKKEYDALEPEYQQIKSRILSKIGARVNLS